MEGQWRRGARRYGEGIVGYIRWLNRLWVIKGRSESGLITMSLVPQEAILIGIAVVFLTYFLLYFISPLEQRSNGIVSLILRHFVDAMGFLVSA